MYSTPQDAREQALVMWHAGMTVASILRRLYSVNPEITTPVDLMYMCVDIFGGTYDQYRIIGGWWIDGLTEISDETLEKQLAAVISVYIPRSTAM